MSGHQAIAAVTAALQSLLQSAVNADDEVVGSQVTVLSPDRARKDLTTGQVNLFLYRTAIDAAWRNQSPVDALPGETGEPPLALSLSYLITAYGQDDNEIMAHRLLGIAMSSLNDQPIIPRALLSVLPGSGVDVQPERVRIVPHPIPMDEISRLWATYAGIGYHISASYDVSPVLIDSKREIKAAPPVLTRGTDDRGPAIGGPWPPVLLGARAPGGRPWAVPGDPVSLNGQALGGVAQVQISGGRLSEPILAAVDTSTPTSATFTLPADGIPAGIYGVATVGGPLGDTYISAQVPLSVAPRILTPLPLTATVNARGDASVTLTCAPAIVAGQSVALVFRDQLVPGTVDTKKPDRLTFLIKQVKDMVEEQQKKNAKEKKNANDVAPPTFPVRLRVDQVDGLRLGDDGSVGFYPLEIPA